MKKSYQLLTACLLLPFLSIVILMWLLTPGAQAIASSTFSDDTIADNNIIHGNCTLHEAMLAYSLFA